MKQLKKLILITNVYKRLEKYDRIIAFLYLYEYELFNEELYNADKRNTFILVLPFIKKHINF